MSDENFKTHITLGDCKKDVARKGTIVVKTKNCSSKLIREVFYVLELAQNLSSVGQLIKKGYMVKFENKCQIYDKNKGQIITTVKLIPNKIFPLKMPFEEKLALTSIHDESTLWHLRFEHINFNNLKLLKQKEMVIGLPSIKNERKICEGCTYGKIQ